METYQESLKTYRDLHNVTETARKEGKIEEIIKGITKALKQGKLSIEEIAEIFDVSINYVLDIQKNSTLIFYKK